MSKTRKYTTDDFDDSDMFADRDFDPESFVQSMEDGGKVSASAARRQRAGWQRVEDLRDARLLKDQLDDWVDWEA